MIGPQDGDGEEFFDITICPPKWLMENYRSTDVLLGLHKLIVFRYDYSRIQKFIEKFLMRCSDNTWEEVWPKSQPTRAVGI